MQVGWFHVASFRGPRAPKAKAKARAVPARRRVDSIHLKGEGSDGQDGHIQVIGNITYSGDYDGLFHCDR